MMVLLQIFLFLQAATQPAGVVTGIVRSAAGAPAAGVRVYAIPVRDTAQAEPAGTVLESIGQTDNAGRYRLEVPPGTYYIAAGSVDSPTYFPGTADQKAARAVQITAGATVESIDFSRFVPANRSPAPGVFVRAPAGTGVLSGLVRFPDGAPSMGSPVLLIPASVVNGTTAPVVPPSVSTAISTFMVFSGQSALMIQRVVTDNTGRYRFANLPADTYYIVAGFAERPTFYPGASSPAAAQTITTTPTTNIDTVNITVPTPVKGVTVRGRVLTTSGVPAPEAALVLQRRNPTSLVIPLMPRPLPQAVSRPGGTFELSEVPAGDYILEARLSGLTPVTRAITVDEQELSGIDLAVPIAVLSGRVLLEDGSPFPDSESIGAVAVTTNTNPNFVATTIVPLDANGGFSRVIEANRYNFYLAALPDGYVIRSITSGTVNLLQEPLEVTGTNPVTVDVRLARRSGTDAALTNVKGKVLDGITGGLTPVQRVELCCVETGPFRRYSTRVREDGSFEYSGVAPGTYTAWLKGPGNLVASNPTVTVGNEGLSGLSLLVMPQTIQISVIAIVEGGAPSALVPVTARFTSSKSGMIRSVSVVPNSGAMVSVSSGDSYRVDVTVPVGFTVKSVRSGTVDLTTAHFTPGPPPNNIVIALAPK